MTREERLKASYDRLLAAGRITQEQYDILVSKLYNKKARILYSLPFYYINFSTSAFNTVGILSIVNFPDLIRLT